MCGVAHGEITRRGITLPELLAQLLSHVLTPMGRRHGKNVDLTAFGPVAGLPRKITGDGLVDLGHHNATPRCGIVQRGHLVPVVLLPLAVLVPEHLIAQQGWT